MTLRTEKKDRRWPSFSSSSDLYPTITPVLSLTSSFATVGRNTGRLYRKRKEWLLKVELLSWVVLDSHVRSTLFTLDRQNSNQVSENSCAEAVPSTPPSEVMWSE